MATSTQLIILFSEHPVFGSLLTPYIAEATSADGQICLIEQAFHASPKTIAQMSKDEQKAIEIASHYSEKYLMQVYSGEKSVAKFLQKLSADPKKIKEKIRPYIEKKLLEMIQTIIGGHLSLFQKQGPSKILYPHHAYRVHEKPADISFSFEVSEEYFSYQLNCVLNGSPLSLCESKPSVVLTSYPATFLLGMNLISFKHIHAPRLIPFTKKKQVSVSSALLPKYIENIVKPIASFHESTSLGLDFLKVSLPCEALLYLEETVYSVLQLRLSFRYGNQVFTPTPSPEIKSFLPAQEVDSETTLRYFARDKEHEMKAISLLLNAGMKQVDESHFELSDHAPEKSLSEWVMVYREIIQQQFRLTDGLAERNYCLDEIHIEQSYDNTPDWFELRITVRIGDLIIPFSRFRKHILEEKREFLLPDGRLLLLPEEWFTKYANLLELGDDNEKSIRLKHSYIGIVEDLMEHRSNSGLPSLLFSEELLPFGLKAELRPYQQKGYNWLVHLYKQHIGGCLADDMGLGKTLQTLALLQYVYKGNGETPEVAVKEETVATKEEAVAVKEEAVAVKEEAVATKEKAVATNTEQAINHQPIVDEMGQFLLFGDDMEDDSEDHSSSDASRNVWNMGKESTIRKPATLIVVPTSLLHNWRKEAKRFTSLSMAEYNSLTRFRAGHPELFFNRYQLIFTSYGMMRNNIDTLRQYCFEYVVLDESQHIKNSDSLTFQSATDLCANHRLVLTGTPIENSLKDLWSQFHFMQPELLGSESAFNKQFIIPIQQNDTRKGDRLRQLISPLLMRRSKREVAPELPPLTEEIIYCGMTDEQEDIYQKEKNSLRNILLESHTTTGHRQPLMVLNGITRLRQLSCHPRMLLPDFTGDAGKTQQVIDTFETIRSEGHKVLIFSSFVKHLELIGEAFRKRGWSYALLTGATTDREEEIARFAQSEDIQAFLISLKAGGVGLNLTQADYVFIIDPWWNPAAEAQAVARAHRIGQDKQVIAYRFITLGSIEEKIIQLQEEKRKLAETFITENDSLSSLSDKEWAELLR